MNTSRYSVLDGIRGFAILNMVIYHGVWDLVYLCGYNLPWYQSQGAYIWQQGICWTFIFLSGFCSPFIHKKLKRGIIILLLGFFVSMCTMIAVPENPIIFGVLTCIGSCTILMIPMEQISAKVSPVIGIAVSILLFVITRNINQGFLGFEDWNLCRISSAMYQNLFTTYLGFPSSDFISSDYFSLLPWVFLYMAGYFTNGFFRKNGYMRYLKRDTWKPLEWLGRHSVIIYILHQPVLYVMFVYFLNKISG